MLNSAGKTARPAACPVVGRDLVVAGGQPRRSSWDYVWGIANDDRFVGVARMCLLALCNMGLESSGYHFVQAQPEARVGHRGLGSALHYHPGLPRLPLRDLAGMSVVIR